MLGSPTMPDRRAFSVAIFVRQGGAVLLIHHRRLDTWLPVGGEIEPGETPLEAAVRELHEETGLHGRFPPGMGIAGTPPGFLGYEEHPAGAKGLHMNFSFVVDVDGRELSSCSEWDQARWVTREELEGTDLRERLVANVRQLVAMALAAPRSMPRVA